MARRTSCTRNRNRLVNYALHFPVLHRNTNRGPLQSDCALWSHFDPVEVLPFSFSGLQNLFATPSINHEVISLCAPENVVFADDHRLNSAMIIVHASRLHAPAREAFGSRRARLTPAFPVMPRIAEHQRLLRSVLISLIASCCRSTESYADRTRDVTNATHAVVISFSKMAT